PRLLDLTGGERDLDVRGKQRRPLQRLTRPCGRPPDGGERGVPLALGEAQLREPRLRFPAEAARLAIRLFGGREFSPQAQQLPVSIMGDTRGRSVVRLDQPLT